MTYDYSGAWDSTAKHNSPLPSQKQTVENMLSKPECTREKLILGMPAYGRTHQLANSESTKIGSQTNANSAAAGPFTGESGFFSYYEVCDKLKEGWTEEWSNEMSVPYAHSGNKWVGYDNQESIAHKAEYVTR